MNALIEMGEQEVYELVTKSGRKIRTTANHPFLARMGGLNAQKNLGTGTANFFTSVNKNVEKTSDSISRMLGATPKNDESRAISTPEIRDIEAKSYGK